MNILVTNNNKIHAKENTVTTLIKSKSLAMYAV